MSITYTGRLIATLLALALIAGGCGSSAGTSATSGSTGASTVATSTTTQATTADDRALSSDSTLVGVTTSSDLHVARYLGELAPIRARLAMVKRSTAAMVAALRAHDARTAGADAYAAAADLRRAAAIARRIHPNQPLASIHVDLIATMTIGAAYLTRMGRDLSALDVASIKRWSTTVQPLIRHSERLYNEWAANVAAFCAIDNVRPPRWLHTMDRWN